MLSSVWELPLPSSFVQTIERVVEQAAVAAGLGRFGEPLGQVGELLAVPVVDLDQLLDGFFVAVRLVRELVVAFVDAEPVHAGVADGVGDLERGDAGEVGGEAADHQLDLQLR